MAQPLQSINLVAPAFKGINSEDSPLAQDPSFAEIADNAVIDKRGRIAARKGNSVITTDNTPLGGDRIHRLHHFYNDSGASAERIFTTANNKIFSGTTTLTDITPGSYTITANNWKIVNFNDAAYFFQRGHEPLVYTPSGGLETFSSYETARLGTTVTTNIAFYCHEALAAYGRIWMASNSAQSQVIYWSDLLIGTSTTGGSAGSIDISKAWPDGHDEIRALAAHNNALIVFGEHSILIFQNAFSPATMSLADTIQGVGCICRNSVQHIGTDVIFASFSGLKSLGRVIQEKSMPINDLSGTIKTEFVSVVESRTEPTASIYSPENSFYLITFPDLNLTYCFDLKATLENGSYRVTRWPSSDFTAYARTQSGVLYTGSIYGVGQYLGYSDNGQPYRFKYYSPGLTFGDPSKIKILKKLRPTIIGAESASVSVFWGYDLAANYKNSTYSVGSQTPFYFNEAEYPSFSALAGYGISSTFVSDSGGVQFEDGSVGYYTVNKYLGELASAPTTGSGGGAILNGDSYFNTTDEIYYVYVSGQWTDLETLTASTVSEYTGGELTSRKSINTSGNGTIITVGVETDINGFNISIQEINVLVMIGRTI